MNSEWLTRSALLLGEDRMRRLAEKHVCVVGLGGVGAYAAEMICRTGIGELTIIDGDTVSPSNINRQLPALHSTMGQLKANVLAARFTDIAPDLKLHVIGRYMTADDIAALFDANCFDFVVDAIDTLAPKIELIGRAYADRIPLISAMGAGGKTDPSQITITDISKTYQCALSKVVRKRLKEKGIVKGVPVVFSPEIVKKESVVLTEGEPNKRSTVGTVAYLPAIFGCYMASYVIQNI